MNYTLNVFGHIVVQAQELRDFLEHTPAGFELWLDDTGVRERLGNLIKGKSPMETVTLAFPEDIKQVRRLLDHYRIEPDRTDVQRD